jgi:beta-galactosidase
METCRKIDPSRTTGCMAGTRIPYPFEDIIGPRYWRPLELKNLAENSVYSVPATSGLRSRMNTWQPQATDWAGSMNTGS